MLKGFPNEKELKALKTFEGIKNSKNHSEAIEKIFIKYGHLAEKKIIKLLKEIIKLLNLLIMKKN